VRTQSFSNYVLLFSKNVVEYDAESVISPFNVLRLPYMVYVRLATLFDCVNSVVNTTKPLPKIGRDIHPRDRTLTDDIDQLRYMILTDADGTKKAQFEKATARFCRSQDDDPTEPVGEEQMREIFRESAMDMLKQIPGWQSRDAAASSEPIHRELHRS
jgi:hypothetical protein